MQTQIYEDDPTTYGTMYVPVIVGSDKTTVSVATGNVEYHPVYLSIGNIPKSHTTGASQCSYPDWFSGYT